MRCFVALWPDSAARDQLDAVAHRLHAVYAGSHRMRRENLHLTLAFIGSMEEVQARRVAQMLQQLRVIPFCWTLDHCGGFAQARVLWAGGPTEPRLAALAQEVRKGLDGLVIAYDRKPFSAHVTLLRNVTGAPALQSCTPIAWLVASPSLVVSERDTAGKVRYRPWVEGRSR